MLKFHAKIAAQNMLSVLPGGMAAYRYIQSNITRATVPTPDMVQQKVDVGLDYLEMVDRISPGFDLTQTKHVEIGSGWHFTIPLLYWQLGCPTQFMTDIERYATSDTVERVASILNQLAEHHTERRRLPAQLGSNFDEWLAGIGMQYQAPVGLPYPIDAESVDLVTATQVLLHPPREIVSKICADAARILRPGGLFIATIHTRDLYENFDPSVPKFNYLRYSRFVWESWFNSSLMAYNRLRPSDYASIVERLPFKISHWQVDHADAVDLLPKDQLRYNAEFEGYAVDDLTATHLTFVLEKIG